ncbi:MAG: NifU family protein [Chloroflexota bacterium]
MSKEELASQIEAIIDKDIRALIEADGGRIKFNGVDEEGVVYVELAGACAGCPGATMTLKGGVQRILQMRLPDVKEVRLGKVGVDF